LNVNDVDTHEHHAIVCCDDHAAHHWLPNPETVAGCWTCDQIVWYRCSLLVSNLALAGALQRAFGLGVFAACAWTSGQLSQDPWEPGCGRPAPQGDVGPYP
jgi:hypothetical protein